MSSSNVFKIPGGIGALASGLLLFLAHLLNLFGTSDLGTVSGESAVLTAHILLVFAFIGLYGEQGERNSLLGTFGMVIGVVGTILVSAIVFVEIAGSSGVDVSRVFNAAVPHFLYLAGPLMFVVGTVLFGVSVMRQNSLPSIGGLLLIVGTAVFALGTFAGTMEPIISVIGSAITGGGFAWLGVYLLKAAPRVINNLSA